MQKGKNEIVSMGQILFNPRFQFCKPWVLAPCSFGRAAPGLSMSLRGFATSWEKTMIWQNLTFFFFFFPQRTGIVFPLVISNAMFL